MPGENGVDTARELQEISPKTDIVFVTTSKEYAVEAFSMHVLHYLVKPVTTEGVVEAFRRLTELHLKNRKKISFTVGAERYTVFLDQICLLENDNHAVRVSLSDGRRLKVWISLGEIEQKLNSSFLKINRGIIVNMDYIVQMGTGVCTLQNGNRLPVAVRHGAAYDDYVFDRLSRQKGF